jgi:5-methylcytosine-specific restriction endonuclease McrA
MSLNSKICLFCGNTFYKPINESKNNWLNRHKYCSVKCRDKSVRSPETIEKMRLVQIGKTAWNKGLSPSQNTRKKISDTLKGRPLPLSTRQKMMGRIPWNKGNGNKEYFAKKIRNSFEGRLWRKAVLERDNYACVWCGSTKRLETDHIKPFALFPELRFAIDNGRTLCHECHKKTDTYGSKINNFTV